MAGSFTIVLLTIVCVKYVYGQNPNSPCYVTGQPVRCEPIFSNVAFGLPIEATNTCGERVVNDAAGRRYSQTDLRQFQEFYRQTGAGGVRKYTDLCDANATDVSKQHPPQNMVDLDASHNTTWWQSITLYESRERGLGDMVRASITLHLGKAYDITYIRLKFHSSRPESFAIYKRTSETSDWVPYQFYSASCRSTYNLPQDGDIDQPTRAICTSDYSDISPLSGADVAFGTLDRRPKSYEFDRNPLLQEFVTATALQIRLERLNTFGDEVFADRSVLQSYYYAISDISVGGKCKCYGHANQCVRSATMEGVGSVVCLCQHNTTGADCGQCLRSHNDKPWAPATILDANACKECDCNGRSTHCYFDQALYDQTGSGGHCQDCRDFTDGAKCERCKPNYFRQDSRDVCRPCNCDDTGSQNQQCDSRGQCVCKPGVTGAKCDRCQANYYDFGSYGCRACGCVEAGSYENKPLCDSTIGQCSCKENVEGQDCSRCKPGYFNLDENNKFGCIACFCNGKTSQCTSAPGYVRAYTNSFFYAGDEGWTAVDRQSSVYPIGYDDSTDELVISTDLNTGSEVYFNAPPRFLGDQKYSYNQFLEFTFRTRMDSGRPSQRDIVLEGNGRSIYLPIFAQNNPAPSSTSQTYRFRLNENPFYQWTPTLSALEFQRLLSSLTAIRIRGTYNRDDSGYLDEVKLMTAHNGQQTGDISSIEQCVCPPQYIGQYCESCAPGYRRETPFGGRSSECVPCECNGHSDTCDAESGACICQHETVGHNCEKCKEGWYGNAVTGTPTDCTPCPCPGQGPCFEQLDMSVSCLNCAEGYAGDLCDMCADGFYSEPAADVNCTMCDCNGNIDSNAVGNCYSTNGICVKCIHHTGGDHCELCLPGFFGNATADVKGNCSVFPMGNLKACGCNTYGTDPSQMDACEQTEGQCTCLPYVIGRQCDRCAEGYYNLESSSGCEACLCSPTGSTSTECDLRTGQCACKPGIGGLRCDQCVPDYFGFSNKGCDSCECLEIGSEHGQCDDSGQCVCKGQDRITGLHCDTCNENKYNLTAGCPDCPACYNLVQDAVTDIRNGLVDLAETLKNINENPTVADDKEFTNQLMQLEEDIDNLLKEANALKSSGDGATKELINMEAELVGLKETVKRVMAIVDESDEKYRSIDLMALNERITNVTEEVSQSLLNFDNESSELYSNIRAALGKAGQKSESQNNMTALAQRSTEIAANQTKDSEEIVQTADNANEVSNNAYNRALEVINNPDDLMEKLSLLKERINEANLLLATVNETAQQALSKASIINNDAIARLSEAERIVVPDIDIDIRVDEAKALLDQALAQKNETKRLLAEHGSLLEDYSTLLANATESYNRTYRAQQFTDELMAEVDIALQKALQAIKDPKDMLAAAQKQLKLLQEFDQNVRDNKEKAMEALKLIPDIEALLEEADNKTLGAKEAVQGAKRAANEAKNIALDAQHVANEASDNAAAILAEAKKTKIAADAASNKTDAHEDLLKKLEQRILSLEPRERAEEELILEVLTEADQARQKADQSATLLENSKKKVDIILKSLENLPELNTTELDRLEMEMDKIEAEYNETNINKQVDDLKQFNTVQMNMANLHANSLVQLREDVANLELILDTIPKPPTCYTKGVLEKAAEPTKKRRRQRKARKRLRLRQ